MGIVYTAVLTYSSLESDKEALINHWLFQNLHWNSPMKPVHDYPCVLVGMWKHFDYTKFLDFLLHLEWDEPEQVCLMMNDDGDGQPSSYVFHIKDDKAVGIRRMYPLAATI